MIPSFIHTEAELYVYLTVLVVATIAVLLVVPDLVIRWMMQTAGQTWKTLPPGGKARYLKLGFNWLAAECLILLLLFRNVTGAAALVFVFAIATLVYGRYMKARYAER